MQAVQCRGMMSVMHRNFFPLSPVCGLLGLAAPTFSSNAFDLQLPGSDLHLLCNELFLRPGDGAALRIVTSRSKAAAHISPTIFGHIVGLAITNAPQHQVKTCLNALGVATNRVHDEWTGVSFARFEKLVAHLARVLQHRQPVRAGSLMPLRFLWEKSSSKTDVLDYLLALNKHAPVLDPRFATDIRWQESWVHDVLEPTDIENTLLLQHASLKVLDPTLTDLDFARFYEILAAGLSCLHASRRAVRLERHSYLGHTLPDCVEVLIREIIQVLIWDASTHTFDTSTLPSTTCPRVVNFFEKFNRNEFASAQHASREWFLLCQELPDCEYLEVASGGRRFEVWRKRRREIKPVKPAVEPAHQHASKASKDYVKPV